MTAYSAHTWKESKCLIFSVSVRSAEDNVSSPQGLSICSQWDQSFPGEASFRAMGIWHMNKMPTFVKNPDNTYWRDSYVAGYTNVLGSCAGLRMVVYAHKASQSICIRSLHIIQVFVLIKTLKLQLEMENFTEIHPTFSELFYRWLCTLGREPQII